MWLGFIYKAPPSLLGPREALARKAAFYTWDCVWGPKSTWLLWLHGPTKRLGRGGFSGRRLKVGGALIFAQIP